MFSNCTHCGGENLTDGILCPSCSASVRFTHRVDCDCVKCAPALVVSVITGWSPATSEEPSEAWTGIDCPVCQEFRHCDHDGGPVITCGSCDTVFTVATPAEVIEFPVQIAA